MELENKVIGQNIARFRKLKDIKAADMASRIGLGEAAYTKYERGETSITLDFVQKVSNELGIDPITLISTTPANIFENFTNSPVSINGNSTVYLMDEKQLDQITKLTESVIALNRKVLETLSKWVSSAD